MIPGRMPASEDNETAGQDVTDIVGQGIVRDRRARLKLPSSQGAVSVLVLVFWGAIGVSQLRSLRQACGLIPVCSRRKRSTVLPTMST